MKIDPRWQKYGSLPINISGRILQEEIFCNVYCDLSDLN